MTRYSVAAGQVISQDEISGIFNKIQNGTDFDINIGRAIYPTGFTSTRFQNAVNSIPDGGVVCLSAATYSLATTISVKKSCLILGQWSNLDRFFPAVNAPSAGTRIICRATTAFTVGSTVGGPIFGLSRVFISGRDAADEPLPDTTFSTGAGVSINNTTRLCIFDDVQVHRKRDGIHLNPGVGEINRVYINRVAFSYNYHGFHHEAATTFRYLTISNLEGYLNQKGLLIAAPAYDIVAYRIDDEASGWNLTDASTTSPIEITVAQDCYLSRVTIDGSKGTAAGPSRALVALGFSDYAFASIDNIQLIGAKNDGLLLFGSAVRYNFTVSGVYAGKNSAQSLAFRGATDSINVGVKVQNAGYGFVTNGVLYGDAVPFQNLGTGKVVVRNIDNYTTQNGGDSSISHGTTVSHGLAMTPARIILISQSASPRITSVKSKSESTFTVGLWNTAGSALTAAGSTRAFWYAEV